MNLLQAWLIIGVPALVVIAAMFTGRSATRALIGYLILAATLVFFLVETGNVVSTAAIGLIGFFLVATGRGTAVDDAAPEHHENRRRFTTTAGSESASRS